MFGRTVLFTAACACSSYMLTVSTTLDTDYDDYSQRRAYVC